MKLMRKGDVTRYVTDKEAQFLASNGYAEVKKEKKAIKPPAEKAATGAAKEADAK